MSNARVLTNSFAITFMIKLLIILNAVGFVYNSNNSEDSMMIFDILMGSMVYHLTFLAVAYINLNQLSVKKPSLPRVRYSIVLIILEIIGWAATTTAFAIIITPPNCTLDVCQTLIITSGLLPLYYGGMILLTAFIIYDILKVKGCNIICGNSAETLPINRTYINPSKEYTVPNVSDMPGYTELKLVSV